MENTNEELQRIEKELLEDSTEDFEKIMQEFAQEPKAEAEETAPAFEDPDKLEFSNEPVVYCNFSNDYGKDLQKEDEEAAARKKKKDDRTIITLLSVAAGLSVGIIGVLVYWLVKFL